MKFKISFDAVRYFIGDPAYALTYVKEYDDGGSRNGGGYWAGGGFFSTEEEATKAAAVIKSLDKTINFEV